MDLLLEIARCMFIFSEPHTRFENATYLQHIDDSFRVDESWFNLSINEKELWIKRAIEFTTELQSHSPEIYQDMIDNVDSVNEKPLWWKNI